MANQIYSKQWSSNPQPLNEFVMVTKLQDFDNTYAKKSILGYIINMTESKSASFYNLRFAYRTSENGTWFPLPGSIYNVSTNTNLKSQEYRFYFGSPISNITGFQLKLWGSMNGEIGINDISIIYRLKRQVNSNTFE